MSQAGHASAGSSPALSGAPRDTRALIAIDLGAESCRVSLLRWRIGKQGTLPHIEMVHRFPNAAVERLGKHGPELRWDIEQIWSGLEVGLRRCAEIATEGVASIAVDGWAVDYVRLDQDGKPLADPFCYRDARNIAAEKALHDLIPPARLYAIAGVQQSRVNTLYQLYADQMAGEIPSAAPWLTLPEYILFRLGAAPVAEYTNAAHTAMVDLATGNWSPEIFAAAGLDLGAAPRLVPPGSTVGYVRGELAQLPAFADTALIAPACHDTASAIAGIPASGADWAYISSGTWSLVGTLLPKAVNDAHALRGNYTNLGAAGGGVCFHKNVNGMWLLRQCIEHWYQTGGEWTVPELVEASANVAPPEGLLDLSDEDLLLPGDMPGFINAQRSRNHLAPLPTGPESAPLFASLIFHSLAARYAQVFADIASITGRTFSRIYIVGGGSRNLLLNRLTEQATGLPVVAGAVESSTLGNFAVQLAALEGAFQPATGVRSDSLAQWARLLAEVAHHTSEPS